MKLFAKGELVEVWDKNRRGIFEWRRGTVERDDGEFRVNVLLKWRTAEGRPQQQVVSFRRASVRPVDLIRLLGELAPKRDDS